MSELARAEHALRERDLPAARAAAERAVEADPGSAAATALLARVLLAEHRPAEALHATERHAGGDADAVDLLRVEALIALTRYAEAARAADALVTRRPVLAAAHLALGRALHYAGEPLRALRAARRAVELAPADADARARLGGMLLASGRLRDALGELARAVALDPALPAARQNLAEALVADGRLADAVDALAPLAEAARLEPAAAAAAVELLEQIDRADKQPRVRRLLKALQSHGGPASGAALPVAGRPPRTERGLLARAGRDLVALARRGALDPVFGRDAEVDLVIDVLLRKKKSNPILVGPAGVGKTAVVEALAQRIADGRAPARLRDARIVELSIASLLAGSAFRGELEEKLESVIAEVRADGRTVLFLDEAHAMVGAGASGGGLGVGEVLKPALSRGDIAVIAATTDDEYERTIARDAALARRFTRVAVAEPARAQALAMLDAAARDLGGFHGVSFAPSTVAAAVDLTTRFLAERRLPDKAIDALDQAAVRAVREGRAAVTDDDVAHVVATLARVPIASLRAGVASVGRLADLAPRLQRAVRGQDTACERVAEVLLVRGLGLSLNDARPRGVFLFAGPSGTGKTALARALADALHGGADRLVHLDMAELMERHQVARLLGAPAGYVGHDEDGRLARALRATPACVVLLDEVDKAHPDVLDVFLQLFDSGRTVDARGAPVDARQATFVLTSNLGARAPGEGRMGFASADSAADDRARREHAALAHVRATLRPELLARLDAVLLFEPLARAALVAIAADQLHRATHALASQGLTLTAEPDVAGALVDVAPTREHGARAIERAVERAVLLPAARLALSQGATAVHARVADGAIVVAPEPQ